MKIMFIKGRRPFLTELKDGRLLDSTGTSFDIIKLDKSSYFICQTLQIGDNVGGTIELSNGC